MFVVLWQFQVKHGLEKEFEKVYGPEGAWADLFRASPAYRGTRLLRDTSIPGCYFTMDFWDSQAAYDAFRSENAFAYAEIDRRCESLTESESHVGRFESSAPPPSSP
ncbi:MAG: antibiotic biosynthesis monooxygenase [Candidatus Acidiferrales bacterium]